MCVAVSKRRLALSCSASRALRSGNAIRDLKDARCSTIWMDADEMSTGEADPGDRCRGDGRSALSRRRWCSRPPCVCVPYWRRPQRQSRRCGTAANRTAESFLLSSVAIVSSNSRVASAAFPFIDVPRRIPLADLTDLLIRGRGRRLVPTSEPPSAHNLFFLNMSRS